MIRQKYAYDELLASPAFADNPYPVYQRLRDEAPVYWSALWGCWVLTRYDDVQATFKDPQQFLNGGRFTSLFDALPQAVQAEIQPMMNHFKTGIINTDPPDHTRLRALVHKAFTPRIVRAMQPKIQALVDGYLDAAPDEIDLIRDLAYPLPVTVITTLLGVPSDERDQFKHWSDVIMAFQASGRTTPAIIRQSQQALLEMRAYLSGVIAQRRAEPQDDLISALVNAEENGDQLTEEEMLITCVTLLIAGHETTTNLIGNGIYLLLTHPNQRQELIAHPELMRTAIEEFLRHETPLQRNRKVAAHDLEFGGQHIRQGQLLLQIVGSANHDPAYFVAPEALNIRRDPNPHIAFGHGIHFCLGAPLARVEAATALRTVLERWPRLRLAAPAAEWHRNSVLRGLRRLPVLRH